MSRLTAVLYCLISCIALADLTPKKEILMNELQVGDKAPTFSLKAQDGKTYSLQDYKGKFVVLYFYPKDDTPGCTKEACSFRDGYKGYQQKGIQVFGASVDDLDSHGKFAKKFNLPFPLLADSEKKLVNDYHVFSNGKSATRYTFIIKPDQTIGYIFKKPNVEVHASEVMEEIQKLKD